MFDITIDRATALVCNCNTGYPVLGDMDFGVDMALYHSSTSFWDGL